jgi:hypothetical protein
VSDQEFEAYLRLLGRFLRLSDEQRRSIGRELRAHMQERLEELLERGYKQEEAIEAILDEFGDAAALASEFGRIGLRRKWIMRTTAGMITAACLVLVVSFLMPENRPLPGPLWSQAQPVSAVPPATAPAPLAEQSSASTPTTILTAVPALDTPADLEARKRLATMLPVMEFPEGTGLVDVFAFLREQGKLSINVNWNALSQVGIDKTTDIGGINLQNVKVETALQVLLDNVGGTENKLGYDVAADGVVRISTTDDLDSNTVTRVYDVRDLLDEPFSAQEQAVIDRMMADVGMGHNGGGTGMMGGGMTGNDKPAFVRQVIEQLIYARTLGLINTLKAAVAPYTWMTGDNSKHGSADIWNGRFIVRQAPRVHREVEAFFQLLRDTRTAGPATRPAGKIAAGG